MLLCKKNIIVVEMNELQVEKTKVQISKNQSEPYI